MPQRQYVSTDPNYGAAPAPRKYVSTDPGYGAAAEPQATNLARGSTSLVGGADKRGPWSAVIDGLLRSGKSVAQMKGAMDRGAEKGALSTLSGLGRLVHNPLVSPLAAILPSDDAAFDQFEQEHATPQGVPEHAGFMAEQVGEFFIPGMAEAKVAKAGRLAKVGAHAVETGAVRAAQTGGDPAQTLAAGALGGVVGALAPAAAEASGPLGQALRLVRSNPKTSMALVSAAPELIRGNYKSAAVEAVLAAAGVKGAQKINFAFRMQKALKAGATAEEALAVALGESAPKAPVMESPAVTAPRTQAPPARPPSGATGTGYRPQQPLYISEGGPRLSVPAPEPVPASAAHPVVMPEPGKVKMATIHQPEGTSYSTTTPAGRSAAAREKLSPKNLSMAERQAALLQQSGEGGSPLFDASPGGTKPALPAKVETGRRVAQAHDRLMAFAKPYGKANPDQKRIQVLLDADGNPSEILRNAAAAGAATKKGQPWVWVKNLWGDSRHLLD